MKILQITTRMLLPPRLPKMKKLQSLRSLDTGSELRIMPTKPVLAAHFRGLLCFCLTEELIIFMKSRRICRTCDRHLSRTSKMKEVIPKSKVVMESPSAGGLSNIASLLAMKSSTSSSNDTIENRRKRMRSPSTTNLRANVAASVDKSDLPVLKMTRHGSKTIDTNSLEEVDTERYGSVTADLEDIERRTLFRTYSVPSFLEMEQRRATVAKKKNKPGTSSAPLEMSFKASDGSKGPIRMSTRPTKTPGHLDIYETDYRPKIQKTSKAPQTPRSGQTQKSQKQSVKLDANERVKVKKENLADDNERGKVEETSPTAEDERVKKEVEYVGVEDKVVSEEGNYQLVAEIEGLDDIWKEMKFALECAKSTRNSSSYFCGSKSTKDKEGTELSHDGVKVSGQEFTVAEIYAHPRHWMHMKPHQIEGFNFLVSNLVSEDPGGCILAHAPGSGKTFMIISFMQSFLAKYPHARPLVLLPKGILATWKKEFLRWQVEDIPLLDFYSVNAENRIQQLEVLQQWASQRSILFLGYKQFSTIVCDSENSNAATHCQNILLTYPSILVMDEGHTARNENTDLLNSLKKVRTPRKVVLSGTLYQNHVKEVFNIFDLVRPKFSRLDTSRSIMKRILGRVPSARKSAKAKGLENVFYESVERMLQKDENFERKVSVIHDLREMTSKVLHFYKGDFLGELPGLVDFTVFLNLSPSQTKEFQELKLYNRNFKISSEGSALYVHPKLRHLVKGTGKEREGIDDSKMDHLLKDLDVREGVKAKFFLNMLALCEASDEKLLVFSSYLQPLKILERLAVKIKGWSFGKEIFVITGDSTSETREWSMDRFNNSPDARVFFGSIKACGEGISLVGASRIIILDVHLNPSVTHQAIGRAFRPGQNKRVYTYRLVAAKTPEEEDHATCFEKESIAKMWFEWNEYCGQQAFEMESVEVKDCGDPFLEVPKLNEDVISLFKRQTAT